MLVKSYVAVFLAFVFVLCYASIDAKHQENQIVSNKFGYADIFFISKIPIDAKPVYFDCGVKTFYLPSRQYHVVSIKIYRDLSFTARWTTFKSTILAYDHTKDAKFNQTPVNWLISPDELVQIIDALPHRRAIWNRTKIM
jgi:hypothetical protein